MSQANSTAIKAIEILLAFDTDKPAWTADEISKRFNMSRASVYRYLGSLLETGLLEVDSGGVYRLGTRVFALARVARKSVKILDIARPHLEALQALTSETVLLSRRQGTMVIVLECLESKHSTRITFDRGHIHPIPASANAKVLLAFAPENEVSALLNVNEPKQYTKHTVTQPSDISEQLRLIRKQGYAINDGEADEEVRAVAAAIIEANGQAKYSVGVVAPKFRLPDERFEFVRMAVFETAVKIGRDLAEFQ
jgi:DNA-binding IclR family transcriptional regulator